MISGEQGYLNLLKELVCKAETELPSGDRTGVGTWNLFHRTLRFDLQKGFPLLTTKKMGFKSILGELLWFISGSTNAHLLEYKYGSTIWREWADESGELGRVYGHQWRNFGEVWELDSSGIIPEFCIVQNGFDQLSWLINEIKTNASSRRLYVTASNPQDKGDQALDTCHNYFQVMIENGKLNLYFQMRSTDVFLGLPYNIASYAILTHMLALECGYEVGELCYSGVIPHLYTNHLEQAKLQLTREPFDFPELVINKKSFFDYKMEDFSVVGYQSHSVIKADVAI